MAFGLIVVFLLCFVPVTTEPITVYNPAWFDPANVTDILINLFSVTTLNACACQCFNNSLCVTGTFFGINQTCALFSAHLSQGQLRLITNAFASVFSFPNRTTNIDPTTNPPAIIEWLFDGNFNDVYGRYNGISINDNGTSWMTPGYPGYGNAVHFSSNSYSLVNHYLNLAITSFTISAWVWILTPFNFTSTGYDYLALIYHCENYINDKCFYAGIHNGRLLEGFFADDLIGNSIVNPNQWYHVSYVYDRSTSKQMVYLNGNLDGTRTPSNPYKGNATQIILGPIPSLPGINFHSGYIDKLTFVSRVKNATELLDEATLVAYYPFDGSYFDAGPNKINNIINVLTTFDSAGRFNQALVINSISLSYFQTTGFYYLGQTNYPYSFSLWIYPFINSGTILQVSSANGWCVPMIGFDTYGRITIQTLGSQSLYVITWASAVSSNVWIHVSMTYSLTFGIRLFVNGSLADNEITSYDYAASGNMSTITIGTCLQPNKCAVDQTKIVPSQFRGKIDELKIFSRELSTNEVSQLAQVMNL